MTLPPGAAEWAKKGEITKVSRQGAKKKNRRQEIMMETTKATKNAKVEEEEKINGTTDRQRRF